MRKQGQGVGSVLWSGGKMPPDTAGKDARRYSSVAGPEGASTPRICAPDLRGGTLHVKLKV
jgi:hypothetical protein